MNFRSLKKELFYIRKAIFAHKNGYTFVRNKYGLGPKILEINKSLQKQPTHANLGMHLLSSHPDLLMLCWSLLSFYTYSKIIGKLYIHDDGSFINRDFKIIKKLFPSAEILNTEKFLDRHPEILSQYPNIYKYRSENSSMPWRKKLIDPYYIGEEPWKLVLDSDVLWFKNPTEILETIDGQENKSCMMALQPGSPVKFKDGTLLSPDLAKFNSGIVLYRRDNFNLGRLSDYLEKVDLAYAPNIHFIEQVGYAICLNNLVGLSQEKYHVKGELNNLTTAKHYTSPRRIFFYTEGLPKLQKLLE